MSCKCICSTVKQCSVSQSTDCLSKNKIAKRTRLSRSVYVTLVCFLLLEIICCHVTLAGACPTCVHGSREITNVFSGCKCVCESGFVGPRCEFGGKRKKSVDFSGENDVTLDEQLLRRIIKTRLLQDAKRSDRGAKFRSSIKNSDQTPFRLQY